MWSKVYWQPITEIIPFTWLIDVEVNAISYGVTWAGMTLTVRLWRGVLRLVSQAIRHRDWWRSCFFVHMTSRSTPAGQSVASDKSWKSAESEPQLTGSWRATEDLLLASLELFHVPGGEDDLVLEKLGFGGRNPDEEIGGQRDCERRRRMVSDFDRWIPAKYKGIKLGWSLLSSYAMGNFTFSASFADMAVWRNPGWTLCRRTCGFSAAKASKSLTTASLLLT